VQRIHLAILRESERVRSKLKGGNKKGGAEAAATELTG
jgi:hypothetical protein